MGHRQYSMTCVKCCAAVFGYDIMLTGASSFTHALVMLPQLLQRCHCNYTCLRVYYQRTWTKLVEPIFFLLTGST